LLRKTLLAFALVSLVNLVSLVTSVALAASVASVASAQESSTGDGQDSLRALQNSFFTDRENADLNSDGIVDFLDLGLLGSRLSMSDSLSDLSYLSESSLHTPLAVAPGNILFFTLPGQSSPVSQVSAIAQESLFLDLHMSFEDTTVGGGIDLLFDDGVLSFIDGVFDDGLGDDPNFRCPTDPAAPAPIDCTPNGPNFVSFGGFPGITGDHLVVTLEFFATSTGDSPIDFTVTSPFSDPTGNPIEVPEPGLAWMAAIATLAALRGRQRLQEHRASAA
jgi:hypothetical protein